MKTWLAGLALVWLAAGAAAQESLDSALSRFYDGRRWQPVWLTPDGISPQADALLTVLATSARDGLDSAAYLTPELESLLDRDLALAETWRLDSLLTRAFLTYARDVSRGRVDPAVVDTQWTAAPHVRDLVEILDRAADDRDPESLLRSIEPPQSGYLELRAALWRYRDLAEQGNWPPDLGRRLAAEGYDTAAGADAAVRQFQMLHGLVADGIVGPATRAALRVPPAARADQIALNLERWRWLPRNLGDRYILVNSAAFSLQLVEHDAVTLTMRAIVGRLDWATPIVSSTATDLVFRPVWRVPHAIAVQELLPIIRKDPGYLARAGFRVFSDSLRTGIEVDASTINWSAVTESTFIYQLIQEPGPENPLGGVKLVFWTPFSVFIHDTPARPLFSERWRTFSHGCVRVEGAAALAARLLGDWPDDSVRAAMTNGRQRWVRLPQPVPVHLVYRTAWVTHDGLVAFTGDPYAWDEELARALDARGVRLTMRGDSLP